MILLQILLATVLVGLISFVGLATIGLKINVRTFTIALISVASGTLLGTAFLHLMPEALASHSSGVFFHIAIGIFFFFVLEKFLIWRHCHLHQRHNSHGKPVAAAMILTGDAVHNFIDGLIIATAFLAGLPVGISVTLAIMLHEIPQEMGDFGVLLNGGYTIKKALLWNALSATTAILGGFIGYFFVGSFEKIQDFLLPIAAGGFLYIALADLIPQLHEETRFRHAIIQATLVAMGFGVIFMLKQIH